jgi:asparagine synthetase B (glutamine-hydrolysing)
VYQGDRRLGGTDRPGTGEFVLPAAAGSYRLVATASRTAAMSRVSSTVSVAWTFPSAHVPGTEPRVLPVLAVRRRRVAPEYRHRLFGPNGGRTSDAADAVEERFMSHYREAPAEDPLDRLLYCDTQTYLPDDILALTDRMSMCHSLEVRVPFLDHELFEFAATIPADQKIKWLQKKRLLKKSVAPLLPGPVLSHKKQGFVGPMSHWLKTDLRRQTLEVLAPERLARHGLFDTATVSRILSDHFDGRETNDTLIWSLVVFQIWFDLYLGSGSQAVL